MMSFTGLFVLLPALIHARSFQNFPEFPEDSECSPCSLPCYRHRTNEVGSCGVCVCPPRLYHQLIPCPTCNFPCIKIHDRSHTSDSFSENLVTEENIPRACPRCLCPQKGRIVQKIPPVPPAQRPQSSQNWLQKAATQFLSRNRHNGPPTSSADIIRSLPRIIPNRPRVAHNQALPETRPRVNQAPADPSESARGISWLIPPAPRVWQRHRIIPKPQTTTSEIAGPPGRSACPLEPRCPGHCPVGMDMNGCQVCGCPQTGGNSGFRPNTGGNSRFGQNTRGNSRWFLGAPVIRAPNENHTGSFRTHMGNPGESLGVAPPMVGMSVAMHVGSGWRA